MKSFKSNLFGALLASVLVFSLALVAMPSNVSADEWSGDMGGDWSGDVGVWSGDTGGSWSGDYGDWSGDTGGQWSGDLGGEWSGDYGCGYSCGGSWSGDIGGQWSGDLDGTWSGDLDCSYSCGGCDYDCYSGCDYDCGYSGGCDYYCDDYGIYDDCYDCYGSSGGGYSISGGSYYPSYSTGGGYSIGGGSYAPISYSYPKVSSGYPVTISAPKYPSTPSYPSYVPTPSAPASIVNNNTNTNTNINNVSATAIAIAPAAQPVVYTTPTYVPPAPVYTQPSPYVSLTQIPYTGFDFGVVGNTMYWIGLAVLALGGAYLAVYYVPQLAFATRTTRTLAPIVPEKAPILVEKEHAIAAEMRTRGIKDTMAIVDAKDGSMPKIVITRD